MTLGDATDEQSGYLAMMGAINPTAALEDRLSLEAALDALTGQQIRLCLELLNGPAGQKCNRLCRSRATVYRQLDTLRLDLLAAGVAL